MKDYFDVNIGTFRQENELHTIDSLELIGQRMCDIVHEGSHFHIYIILRGYYTSHPIIIIMFCALSQNDQYLFEK